MALCCFIFFYFSEVLIIFFVGEVFSAPYIIFVSSGVCVLPQTVALFK